MKNSKLYHKIGAWALIIIGMIHLIGHLSMSPTEEQMILAAQMKAFKVAPLIMESNMLNFHNGFSFLMAFLIISYGLINVLLLKYASDASLDFRPILLLNSFVASVSCIISILYFFILPITFTGIASLAFICAYIAHPQKTSTLS